MENPVNWHVFFINCDCASGYHARRRKATVTNNGSIIMNCPWCKTPLGYMQFNYVGTFKAKYPEEAIRIYKETS